MTYVVLSLFFSWKDGNVEHWCVLPMRMGSTLGWKEKKNCCWNTTTEIQLNIGGWHDGYTSAFGKVPRKCRCAPVKISSLCSWGQHPRVGVKLSLCQASHGSSAPILSLVAGSWLVPKWADSRLVDVCIAQRSVSTSQVLQVEPAMEETVEHNAPHSTGCKHCFGFLLIP